MQLCQSISIAVCRFDNILDNRLSVATCVLFSSVTARVQSNCAICVLVLGVVSTFFHLLLIFCPSTVGFGRLPETLTFLFLVSLLPTIESFI